LAGQRATHSVEHANLNLSKQKRASPHRIKFSDTNEFALENAGSGWLCVIQQNSGVLVGIWPLFSAKTQNEGWKPHFCSILPVFGIFRRRQRNISAIFDGNSLAKKSPKQGKHSKIPEKDS